MLRLFPKGKKGNEKTHGEENQDIISHVDQILDIQAKQVREAEHFCYIGKCIMNRWGAKENPADDDEHESDSHVADLR